MIPFVILTLDKPYNLRFGMGAMTEWEQLTGHKLADLTTDMTMTECSNILLAILRQDDKKMTIERVCKLVDDYADNLTDVQMLVSKACELAWEQQSKSKNAQTLAALKKSADS